MDSAGPDYTIPDEINELPYEEGTVGMALSGPDTGGSQWFVTLSPQAHLDGRYTVFGRVTQGMQVFRTILAGDHIENVSIERIMSSADRHEVEMELAAERLAKLQMESVKRKKLRKEKAPTVDPNDLDNDPAVDVDLLKKKDSKKQSKKNKKDTPVPVETEQVPAESPPPEDPEINELPEEHEKPPDEEQLNEGEKVDVDALIDDDKSDE